MDVCICRPVIAFWAHVRRGSINNLLLSLLYEIESACAGKKGKPRTRKPVIVSASSTSASVGFKQIAFLITSLSLCRNLEYRANKHVIDCCCFPS